MPKKVQEFFKENLSPILFFGLIIFGIASVWVNGSLGGQNAQKLTDFANQSAPTVRTEIARITNKTLLLDNVPESYDQISGDLKGFSQKLDSLTSQIPTQNNDPASLKLEDGLKSFFLAIKQDTVKIQDRVNKQKDLLDSSNTYGTMKKLNSDGGSKDDLSKAYEAGVKIQNFQVDQSSSIQDGDTKTYNQERNEANQKILDQVKDLLTKMPVGPMNLSDRDDLAKIYNDNWPLENPPFPRITKDELENQVFAQNIQSLQQNLSDVKSKYNLK